MKNKNLKIVLSKLITSNYQVFIPVFSEIKDVLVVSSKSGLEFCLCLSAYLQKGEDSAPVLSLTKQRDNEQRMMKENDFDSILVVEENSQTVWKIPLNLISSNQIIRLGKKYENYILKPAISNRPFSQSKDSFVEREKTINIQTDALEKADFLKHETQDERTIKGILGEKENEKNKKNI